MTTTTLQQIGIQHGAHSEKASKLNHRPLEKATLAPSHLRKFTFAIYILPTFVYLHYINGVSLYADLVMVPPAPVVGTPGAVRTILENKKAPC